MSRLSTTVGAVALGSVVALTATAASSAAEPRHSAPSTTTTPIKHLVVIYQENVSFDHYFGTYPKASNTSGQPFHAARHTRAVNNLVHARGAGGRGNLLTNNPNRDAAGNQVNPRRLDPANLNDVLTCDEGHNYDAEQKAFDGGKMDKFITTVGRGAGTNGPGQPCKASDVMNYYDGNTVTGLWNYAQHYAMSDNSFGTTFGPSSPGAINLVSGDTGGVDKMINGAATNGDTVPDGTGGHSLIEDAQPYYDDCSTRDAVSLSGKNVGDNLNAAGVSWGWFEGGFRPTTSFATATGGTQPTSTFTPDQFKGKFASAPASDQGLCNAVHPIGAAVGGTGGTTPGGSNYGNKDDYIAHHEPFQYYRSTANPHHLPPASLSAIGTDTQTVTGGVPQFNTANHQYDMSDFDALVAAISHGYASPDLLPAVSFLKAPGYQDGHPGYSDPIDEQQFVTTEINALQHTPDWASTAVVIAYDDSDGWYDHAYSGIHNPSNTATVATPPGPQDFLTGTGLCGNTSRHTPLAGQNGRCGYGPRLPLIVISPWARHNYVDHTLTDQSSILRGIEDNWRLPRIAGSFDSIAGSLNHLFDFDDRRGENSKLYLDPVTGQPARQD
ncbi:phospholipase C [Jatrophihabitans lederbergiae]|uniref:Alkaline phosphatase family protein n=1 Tax=Jatrophihabitans lederbergiae TaxID=3075547 RepID=A0ABU2JD75_9ACTN|nr:alkaline phosphatase family protein [Jatrophihabitans sp. DSM 44399]MDT0262936.1 alkaline phosphatase family protein [Jatrophihabitans sp. DSM 44399]